jgi:hypothetical protein
MGEALVVFWTGSLGVFLGMALLYAAIRLMAVIVDWSGKGKQP